MDIALEYGRGLYLALRLGRFESALTMIQLASH